MAKYLWELHIEKIPCGWEDLYQEALREYPDGKISSYEDEPEGQAFRFDPVKCREILIKKFNLYKKRAVILINQKNTLSIREFMSEILVADVAMFCILNIWVSDTQSFDVCSFNPKNYLDDSQTLDFDFYLSYDSNHFKHLRVLNTTDPASHL